MSPPPRTTPLNIPQGNSAISPEAPPIAPDEALTGDTWTDIKRAITKIDPISDLKNIGTIPCARSSLLYGIGGGVGLGGVRFIASRRYGSASNWAVLSFVAIASFTKWSCEKARARELQSMRTIQERFADRHVSKLKRKPDVEVVEKTPRG